MRAVVVSEPGPAEVLTIRDVPVPSPAPGQVLIRVMAFGLNRSELHFRRGLAYSGSFPRVPGIEAAGIVEAAPGGEFEPGTQVVTMMGGMGRDFDGGYAEFVVVPSPQVISFTSTLPWEQLGAVPEMLQTAYGSLFVGLQAEAGQTLLIRGGTSSIGLALAVLGKLHGLTVLSTTRRDAARPLLESVGVDHVLIDDGHVAEEVRRLVPGGVDRAVELVGVNVMKDTLRAVPTSGRFPSSIRWSGCRTGCVSPRTRAKLPTCLLRNCRHSWMRWPGAARRFRSAAPMASMTSSRRIATWNPAWSEAKQWS
jgi:NADPH2:quinone reductase